MRQKVPEGRGQNWWRFIRERSLDKWFDLGERTEVSTATEQEIIQDPSELRKIKDEAQLRGRLFVQMNMMSSQGLRTPRADV